MLHEVDFLSFNERDTVYGWIYVPAAKAKGIVQVIHGFGEHSRRYLHMISAFLDAGYIVAADDHVGHGKTALENDTWGDWGDKGLHTMMEDEHTLKKIVSEKYPDLPYFFFGHSMGSFIAKDYATKYGDGLAGITLCGTAGVSRGAAATELEQRELVDSGQGKEAVGDRMAKQMGWMCERVAEVKIGNEWICADPYVQIDHAEDPFDAFMRPINNQSLWYFYQLMEYIVGTEWAEKIPTSLPFYNIAGDGDPVGEYGVGVYLTSNWLYDTGHQVTTKLYSGYRHEIHNYNAIKNEVEQGIIAFMDGIIEKA